MKDLDERFCEDGLYDPMPGANINSVIAEAIDLASEKGSAIKFKFNGVIVTVEASSSHGLIYRDWFRSMSGYISKEVGPYPAAVLSPEELESDAAIEAVNEERRREQHAEYEQKQNARRQLLENILNAAPIGKVHMDLKPGTEYEWEQFVEKNQDAYGHGVIHFAETWARVMEIRIASGVADDVSVEQCISDTAAEAASLADTEGITGFMYGCAVAMLSKCWKHGEELRRWHNLKTQVGTEGERANESGGVLNPALVTLSVE